MISKLFYHDKFIGPSYFVSTLVVSFLALHIYRPRRFQRTWFGVNQPRGCYFPASALFQKPLLQIPGAFITSMGTHLYGPDGLMTVAYLEAEAVPVNLIWNESVQWLQSYGPYERTDGRKPFHSPPVFLWKGQGTIRPVKYKKAGVMANNSIRHDTL